MPTGYQEEMCQLVIRRKCANWLSGGNRPTGYQEEMGKLVIRRKCANWLSGGNGPTGYQEEIGQLEIIANEAQLMISAIGTTKLQTEQGPTDEDHGNMDQHVIKMKLRKGPISYIYIIFIQTLQSSSTLKHLQ